MLATLHEHEKRWINKGLVHPTEASLEHGEAGLWVTDLPCKQGLHVEVYRTADGMARRLVVVTHAAAARSVAVSGRADFTCAREQEPARAGIHDAATADADMDAGQGSEGIYAETCG